MFREKIRPQVFSGFTDSKGNFRKFTVSGYRTFQVGSESAFIANAQSPVELLVMDPIGRLVGFEPRTGINYNEITGASYFQDDPLVDDTDDGPNTGDPTGIKSVYIPSPLAGTYQVMVTGTGNGLYTIDLQTSGPDVVGQAANYSGTAAVGVQFTNYFTVLPTQISIVQNGGFETGDFTGWTLSGSDTNDIFIDDGSQTGIVPHSGNYLAALAPVGSFSYLSQTLATIAGVGYSLSLWLNSPDGLTPNKFLVSWNGNALFDQTNLPAIGWTNMQFTVTATGSSTVLQFGSQDDNRFLGLDDISVVQVVGMSTPSVTGFSLSGTNLVLNGSNGLSGGTYYVMMSTNLALPLSQWTPVATNVLSASGNFTMTGTNVVNRDARQQFYRIMLVQ